MAFLRPGSALSSKAWRPGHHVLDIVSSPAHPLQIYRTATRDPYLNLSIEHYLLQNSHPESTVLFLYRNSPSVVIGRNQNPWLEVNLSRLRAGLPTTAEPVRLVRRRSGGGAVFHDDGNVNWSVICPPPSFDRDKHAEMVVRALRRLGVQDVRVNCRHDIVMGGGRKNKEGERKISGSAYKLTRLRSLHHGTCLLSSPHLAQISGLLRSPAEPYIKARGVESVRSKIANVERGPEEFCTAIQDEFQAMYKRETAVQAITDSQCEWPADLQKGYEELKSLEWIYGQTPQFTFSTHSSEGDPRTRPELPNSLPPDLHASFTARHGRLQDVSISGLEYSESIDSAAQDVVLSHALAGTSLHLVDDWAGTLRSASPVPLTNSSVGSWLNSLFGLSLSKTSAHSADV